LSPAAAAADRSVEISDSNLSHCLLTRFRSWQTIRANDITKAKEKKEEALFRQTAREREIRKHIEDIVEPFNHSCVEPTTTPLKASKVINDNAIDGDRKKGKKRKNPP
jgi:COMPASS component SPP1